mgnify:CR=1 FL=1
MKRHIIVFSLILMSVGYNQDYEIDEYTFEWLVDEVRNVKMEIRKEEDRVQVVLGYDMKSLFLTPTNAEAIGRVLSTTDKYYLKMKDSPTKVTEKVDAGDYYIQFQKSEESGFNVFIAKPDDYFLSFSLDRKTALGLSKYLMESKAMIDFLNQKLKL